MYNSNIGYFMCVFNFRSSLQSVEYFLQGEEASCLLFAVLHVSLSISSAVAVDFSISFLILASLSLIPNFYKMHSLQALM